MDVVGLLPTTASGNQYILVICDYATRYPAAYPLQTFTAPKVAENLVDFFSLHGTPQEILTDQGTNFSTVTRIVPIIRHNWNSDNTTHKLMDWLNNSIKP